MSRQGRDTDLGQVLRLSRECLQAPGLAPGPPQALSRRIFEALEQAGDCSSPPAAQRLPVCRHLDAALEGAREAPGRVPALAEAFARLCPRLAWATRPGAAGAFLHGHANALLVGPRGLERRHDVMVGVSLVAPDVQYPDHHHPPEEVYVVLTPGEWRQEAGAWHEPGPGGIVHNPPGIVHAMRAGSVPLLALWFLWTPGHGLT